MTEEEMTTIRISKKMRDRLAGMGNKDDTFDDILWKIIGGEKK